MSDIAWLDRRNDFFDLFDEKSFAESWDIIPEVFEQVRSDYPVYHQRSDNLKCFSSPSKYTEVLPNTLVVVSFKHKDTLCCRSESCFIAFVDIRVSMNGSKWKFWYLHGIYFTIEYLVS